MWLALFTSARSEEPLPNLGKAEITQVITTENPEFTRCYDRALRKDPTTSGKLVVQFVIEPDGTVERARVKSSTFAAGFVPECVLRRFVALRFPAPAGGGITVVAYPFVFLPAGTDPASVPTTPGPVPPAIGDWSTAPSDQP